MRLSCSMPVRKRAPTHRHQEILALYRQGVAVAEIAELSGVCVKTVRNVARRAGVPARNPSQPDRDAHVVAQYRGGERVAAIAADHGISSARVRAIAARAGVRPRSNWRRRYPLDEDAFDTPTPVGWWLIGLLAADGSIDPVEHRVSLCQSLKDRDVLEAFYRYVGCPERPLTLLRLSPEARRRQLRRGPAAEARIFSQQIVRALATHGVVPRKSKSLTLGAAASSRAAVWLGLLDGDGSVGIYRAGSNPRVLFAGSRPLMTQCARFWRDALGFSGPPSPYPHRGGIWVFALNGRKAVKAAQVLLASTPVSMARKRELLAEIAGRDSRRPL
jgi:hypothetical protein